MGEKTGPGGKGEDEPLTKALTGPRLHNVFFKIKFLIMLWAVKLQFRKWGELKQMWALSTFFQVSTNLNSVLGRKIWGLKNVKFKSTDQRKD